MASIGNMVIRVFPIPGPSPYSLCQEWIGPPAWWARPLALNGLACFAVCCVAPEANGHAILMTGILFGSFSGVVWTVAEIACLLWRESR